MRVACLVGFLFLAPAASAQPEIPLEKLWVTDVAGMIDVETERLITDFLVAHEDSTTNQVVVVTIPSLQGASIEAFARQIFNTWGVGQESQNNGVLLLVSRDDRELRIEVGLGLEGVLTDAESGRIIRNNIVPEFRNGDFDAGILSGVVAILSQLEGASSAKPDDARAAYLYSPPRFDFESVFAFVVSILALLVSFVLGRGWVVKTGAFAISRRKWSFFLRYMVAGPALGLFLFLMVPVIRQWAGYGHYEWWAGVWFGLLLWPVVVLLVEYAVARKPVWIRFRRMQTHVEIQKIAARRDGKRVQIQAFGRTYWYDGRVPTSSGSSGSSYSSSSSFSSSSSSFSGGGGSSGGGGASGSW